MLESVKTILIIFTTIMIIALVVNKHKQPGDLLVFIMFLLYLFYLLNS